MSHVQNLHGAYINLPYGYISKLRALNLTKMLNFSRKLVDLTKFYFWDTSVKHLEMTLPAEFNLEKKMKWWNSMPLQPLHIYLTQIPMLQKGWKSSTINENRMISASPSSTTSPLNDPWGLPSGPHNWHFLYPYTRGWSGSPTQTNPAFLSKALQTSRVKNIHQSTLSQRQQKNKNTYSSNGKKRSWSMS